jgi:DNA-binding SARP family transcriptional activator/transcriptional regulator with XRE-family HTH domain
MKAELAGRVRFRILGPVELQSGQRWQGVDDEEWRSLLSCLLLRPGELVSVENLAAALWGDDLPGMPGNLIGIYVQRLRRLIGDPRGQVLARQGSSYQLCIGLGDLDLLQFEALVEDGRSALTADNPGTAAVLLGEALGLWRGPALADVKPTAFFTAHARRLAELRVTAAELRATADLACGRPSQLIPGLRQLAADNPHREGLQFLLARAHDEAESRRSHASAAWDVPSADTERARTAPEPAQSGAHAVAESSRAGDDTAGARQEFGSALDAARIGAGLTLQDAARSAGISHRQAAGYFAGKDLPYLSEAGLKSFHAILAACGITDPVQVIEWTYALARSSPAPESQPLPVGRHPARADGPASPGPGQAIPDSPGAGLCPDPAAAQTTADLLAALSRFRIWAGEPSFQDMQRLSEPTTAASTMCTALGSGKLPSLRVVRAIITGCGGTPEQVQAFAATWRRIRLFPGQPDTQPEPSANRTLYPVRGTATPQPCTAEAGAYNPSNRDPRRRPA